nr:E3 binding domain-containing protein [Anaerolineae bacterium]
MAIDIIMPNTGFDSQTSRLIEWLKAPGDPVARGETLAIVESDKAEVELEALAGGVLLEHSAAAGAEVTVGAVIGRIGSVEEYRARQSAAAPSAPAPAARVSPVARRMARQHNIALEQVAGSGAGGRIMRRDIEALAAPAPAAAGTAGVVLALPRVRRAARERGIALPAVLAAGYAS